MSSLAKASDRDAIRRELHPSALNHDLVGKSVSGASFDWLYPGAYVRLGTSGPSLNYPVSENPTSNDPKERRTTARRIHKFALVNLDVADLRKKEIGVLDDETAKPDKTALLA